MIPGIQEWIHRLEVGEGTRYVKMTAVILGLLALTVVYDIREFKNFSSQEAMDAAQLARNISEGNGYTTDFIRPLSIHLIQSRRGQDTPILKEPHPDLANPPVYPLLLAGLMKVLPFRYDVQSSFWHHQPELLIAIFNQALFFGAISLVYYLGRRLFDQSVASLSALIFAGTNLFWKFSVSGLSTIMLLVVFLGVVWCLVEMEEHNRSATRGNRWFITIAIGTGVLIGIGGLTRYSFGWLILPVVGFFAFYFGQRRWVLAAVTLGAFLLVMSPWLARNYSLSGTLLGIPGFAINQDSPVFPGNRLERFLNRGFEAELSRFELEDHFRKLFVNVGSIIERDLPNLAGNWTSVFFLVGLMLPFRNVALNRTRVFILLGLGTLAVVQALGRTYLSDECPVINSENLLVLLAPMVFVFGVGMFFLLLDQVNLPFPQLRSVVTSVFGLGACAPLVLSVLPPRSFPVAFQPYTPPGVQEQTLIRYWPPAIEYVCEWMRDDELIMSDMPWAVAWYGNRRCVWLTLDAPSDSKPAISSDFFAINDYQKPIRGLFLTRLTSDARLFSQILRDKEYDWSRFMLESLARTNVPSVFPLKCAPQGFMRDGLLFLSDRVRWRERSP